MTDHIKIRVEVGGNYLDTGGATYQKRFSNNPSFTKVGTGMNMFLPIHFLITRKENIDNRVFMVYSKPEYQTWSSRINYNNFLRDLFRRPARILQKNHFVKQAEEVIIYSDTGIILDENLKTLFQICVKRDYITSSEITDAKAIKFFVSTEFKYDSRYSNIYKKVMTIVEIFNQYHSEVCFLPSEEIEKIVYPLDRIDENLELTNPLTINQDVTQIMERVKLTTLIPEDVEEDIPF